LNSGSEAVEAALKLAKRHTGRTQIIAMRRAYHGSTHGAMSLMDSEDRVRPFRPLLPDVDFIAFNNEAELSAITERTACVIAEPIQAEAGVALPENDYLQKLRHRCTQTGAMLIFDEVQTALGRVGDMFAFAKYGALPDMLVLAKALGGGMPLGALLSAHDVMNSFTHSPVLGHITTFGGHPVSCAASLAMLEVMEEEKLVEQVQHKSLLFKRLLAACPAIVEVRGEGLLLAAQVAQGVDMVAFLRKMMEAGLLTDGFLHCPNAFRIAPPLNITSEEITMVCQTIAKL
jgi:acetylornithine/succinyldiaminopimelate/putrescine aminotransferase